MGAIQTGDTVQHRTDLFLGQGRVASIDAIAGVVRVGIRWSGKEGLSEHTQDQLIVLRPLVERLSELDAKGRVPFQLKVFGRWFEARHSLTGELSNQPFQMLPHQVIVTNRVVNSALDGRAWLIADDVGLGKTIEAGMIMEVLRKKTLGRFRCLVVCPAGLRPQWRDELSIRFARNFRVFDSRVPNDLEAVDQLIASIDTLKLARLSPAIAAATPWDLVIFDEAHHLATTTDVQTYKLAQFIRANKKARNVLFLSATPHSGNNKHFFNMLRLLREDLFPGTKEEYPSVPLKDVMIRNRKSDVTDVRGQKIFKGIAPAQIIPFTPTPEEVGFYEELTAYLRTGYKVADKLQRQKSGQKASAVGFLMATFGKLASSSRAAIRSALANRLVALRGDGGLENGEEADTRFPGERAARTVSTQAIVENPKKKKKESLIDNEASRVEQLLKSLDALTHPDSKLTSFVDRVKQLPRDVKLLIFTEYRSTQAALVSSLIEAFGESSAVTIHGSMDMDERRQQVSLFNEQVPNPRFMVSTEAGGEGLNMQKSCHTVVNYDLPWNPMALQQRIGRVYRYGQHHPVVVLNLKVDSSSEAFADQRVYEYLERKIEEITKKLAEVQDGQVEDIRGEVLGQVATQIQFDDLYKTAVEQGHSKAQELINSKADHIRQILGDKTGLLGLFRGLERFDITDYERVAARVETQHLAFFVERYLELHGSNPVRSPDGLLSFQVPKALVDVSAAISRSDPYSARHTVESSEMQRATVDKELAQNTHDCRLLRFGEPAFEAMVTHVQQAGFTQGVAAIELPADVLGWEPGTTGTWVLFDLRIVRQERTAGTRVLRNELLSLLVSKDGSAVQRDHVVEAVHQANDLVGQIDEVEARRGYELAKKAAEAHLKALYEEVIRDSEKPDGILPQEAQDVALAWVQAR